MQECSHTTDSWFSGFLSVDTLEKQPVISANRLIQLTCPVPRDLQDNLEAKYFGSKPCSLVDVQKRDHISDVRKCENSLDDNTCLTNPSLSLLAQQNYWTAKLLFGKYSSASVLPDLKLKNMHLTAVNTALFPLRLSLMPLVYKRNTKRVQFAI